MPIILPHTALLDKPAVAPADIHLCISPNEHLAAKPTRFKNLGYSLEKSLILTNLIQERS
jgi:hypothetical protein